MSLTNYILQSMVGLQVFYHRGFSLYDDWGIIVSFLFGVTLFLLQFAFCRW